MKDEFIRHTGLMFIGIGLFNLFNLLYHFFMVRYLPPIEYGHLNTLMALFMVISVPASTVQTTVTKFVSSFQVQNRYDRVKRVLWHLLLLMSMVAFTIFLLIVLGSSRLSSFFQISSQGSIVLMGMVLFFAMVIPVPWGGLQGLQKFGSLTFNLIVNGALKFALGILFVLIGFGVSGAMGAILLSYIVTTFLSLIILKMNLPKGESIAQEEGNPEGSDPSYVSEVYKYFFPVGMTLLCFMVLTNIDLFLIKHFFTPIEAGYYSIAQMVGKIILFVPVPVVMVMFPKLSALEGQARKALLTLRQSLIFAVFLCGTTVLVGLLFPSLIIKILSGKVYFECILLVRFFCINMSFFSLLLILLYYHLSTHRRGFLYPLFFFTIVQTGLIMLFHKTLTQVLSVMGIVAICLFGINLYLAYHPDRRMVKN
jgi:O-antigen/teichoic acid export membrane protein